MKGVIKIIGDIGQFYNEQGQVVEGVTLTDVIGQVKKQPQATSFDVIINSNGGSVKTGMDIYKYLKSLKVPLTTIGEKVVASIATVIFMAGDVRKVHKNITFMIHLPSGGVTGTSEEIAKYNEMLQKVEKDMIKFYSDGLNLDADAVKSLLEEETILTEDELLNLGLITEVPFSIAARLSLDINQKPKSNKMSKKNKKSILDQIINLINGQEVVGKMLYDANNMEIVFADVDDETEPQVGDTATVDGKPAEGEYTMPNGDVMKFEGGELKEIVPATDGEDEPTVEELQNQIEQLTASNDDLTEKNTTLTNEVASITSERDNANRELATVKAQLKQKNDILNKIKNFKPTEDDDDQGGRQRRRTDDNEDGDSRFSKAFANIK